jgi:hypothetical protein
MMDAHRGAELAEGGVSRTSWGDDSGEACLTLLMDRMNRIDRIAPPILFILYILSVR